MTDTLWKILIALALAALAGLLPAAPARAADFARVAKVIDATTLTLTDGRMVRLAGVLAPGMAGESAAQPLMEATRAALAEMVLNHKVEVWPTSDAADRYGRLRAHLYADGTWVQGELLRRGLARVATAPEERDQAVAMLAAEREGREAKLGLWAKPAYAIRQPGGLDKLVGTFQIVEGRAQAASNRNGRIHIAFGSFTATLKPAAARLCKRQGLDPLTLAGRKLRVRGWLERQDGGPAVEVTHPEQLELADDAPDRAPAVPEGLPLPPSGDRGADPFSRPGSWPRNPS